MIYMKYLKLLVIQLTGEINDIINIYFAVLTAKTN